PLSHDRTVTLFEWYFRDPDGVATRRLVEETVAFSDEIQREDIAICEAVQKGLKSRTYDRGRYSVRRENGVHHFHRLYAAAMA
ncbi:MAG TPA: SRPBCC family protein, partial [Thermoanaerobaculia bacterium]|nr:SRPBCC family protein [Thermoanaerobaculia bacterium]